MCQDTLRHWKMPFVVYLLGSRSDVCRSIVPSVCSICLSVYRYFVDHPVYRRDGRPTYFFEWLSVVPPLPKPPPLTHTPSVSVRYWTSNGKTKFQMQPSLLEHVPLTSIPPLDIHRSAVQVIYFLCLITVYQQYYVTVKCRIVNVQQEVKRKASKTH